MKTAAVLAAILLSQSAMAENPCSNEAIIKAAGRVEGAIEVDAAATTVLKGICRGSEKVRSPECDAATLVAQEAHEVATRIITVYKTQIIACNSSGRTQ
jgi:hypothetical protein